MTDLEKEARDERERKLAEFLNVPVRLGNSSAGRPGLRLVGVFAHQEDAEIIDYYFTQAEGEACDRLGTVMQLSDAPGFALYHFEEETKDD